MSVYESVFVPILTCRPESWDNTPSVITELPKNKRQRWDFSEKFPAWHFDKVGSCDIHKVLNAEPLLWIERSQLRRFGHVSRMSQERLAKHVLLATPTGKRPKDCPKTRGRDYISSLAWSCLAVEPDLEQLWDGWKPWSISSPGAAAPATLPRGKAGMK